MLDCRRAGDWADESLAGRSSEDLLRGLMPRWSGKGMRRQTLSKTNHAIATIKKLEGGPIVAHSLRTTASRIQQSIEQSLAKDAMLRDDQRWTAFGDKAKANGLWSHARVAFDMSSRPEGYGHPVIRVL